MSPHGRLSQRARWAGGEPIANRLMARTLAQPELVSLAAGFVDNATLPVEPTQKAVDAIWSNPSRARAALQYGTTIGLPALREAVLDRMLKADGRSAAELNTSVEQVVITAGSNQILYLASDALLDPQDIVLCGTPSYYVYLGILENLGARAIGVEMDEHGLIPEALDEMLTHLSRQGELGRVKLVYVTSYYDNPSGVTVPAERRAALVEIVKRWSQHHKLYLIEDAAYREMRYYGDDTPSLRSFDTQGDTVLHAGTFSKSFSPGVRVGWAMLPPALRTPILAQKGHIDFGSPNFNQQLMATVVELGLLDEHLATLRDSYRAKIDAMLEAADELLAPISGMQWVRPTGGLYVWLQLPETIDTSLDGPLFERAVDEGVLYVPGEYFFPPEPQGRAKNMLRLSFGIQSSEGIRRGVEALARAIRGIV